MSNNYKILNYINEEEWSNFVLNHPKGNIFQSPEMYNAFKKTKNYEPIFFSVLNKEGNILAVLLAVIQKENNKLVNKFSRRTIIWGGPLVKNNNHTVFKYILAEFDKCVKKKSVYTQFRNFWNINALELEAFKNKGYNYYAHLDIIHDLSQSKDDIFSNFSKGRRKNIRRAEKSGVKFYEIKDIKDFSIALNIILETYNKINIPVPDKSLFINTFETYNQNRFCRFFILKKDNNIIATRFVLCYKELIYDWYAGNKNEYLSYYPNDIMPWKIMCWGKDNGYKKFDFGGAGNPNKKYGVRDYKLKFGGKTVEFGRLEKINNVIIYTIAKNGFLLLKYFKNKLTKKY